MAKVRREEVTAAGLQLLDEVGLDAFTTRKLAQRLGIESATLYWHFRDKASLLAEMSATVLLRQPGVEIPGSTDRWPEWFADNARGFRRALLTHRDGARLHAGTTPTPQELARVVPKIDYLLRVGFAERDALMALYAAGQFTLGCVLEEQARLEPEAAVGSSELPGPVTMALEVKAAAIEIVQSINESGEDAFEFGLNVMVDGLRRRVEAPRPER